jgi:hypothetical protein
VDERDHACICRVMGAWARESRSCQCTMGTDCRIVSTNPHLKNVIDSMRRMQMACRCTGGASKRSLHRAARTPAVIAGTPAKFEAIQPPLSREKFTYPDTTRGVTLPRRALGWLKPTLKIRHFVGCRGTEPPRDPSLRSACERARRSLERRHPCHRSRGVFGSRWVSASKRLRDDDATRQRAWSGSDSPAIAAELTRLGARNPAVAGSPPELWG